MNNIVLFFVIGVLILLFDWMYNTRYIGKEEEKKSINGE